MTKENLGDAENAVSPPPGDTGGEGRRETVSCTEWTYRTRESNLFVADTVQDGFMGEAREDFFWLQL